MTDNYSIDKCNNCGKYKPLKNGICKECEDREKLKNDLPNFMKDLFRRDNE